MLEETDIQRIQEEIIKAGIEVFATKEDVSELREDLNSLREMVQALVLSVDKLVKSLDNLRDEYFAIRHQIDRHEKWIRQIAEKLGIKLEY